MAQLEVTQIKSTAGRPTKQRLVLKDLQPQRAVLSQILWYLFVIWQRPL